MKSSGPSRCPKGVTADLRTNNGAVRLNGFVRTTFIARTTNGGAKGTNIVPGDIAAAARQ